MSKELQVQVGTSLIISTPTFTLTHWSVKCCTGNGRASWLKLVRLDACHQLRWLNRVLAPAATSLLQPSDMKPETNFTITVTTLFPNLKGASGFNPYLVGSPGRPFPASTSFSLCMALQGRGSPERLTPAVGSCPLNSVQKDYQPQPRAAWK